MGPKSRTDLMSLVVNVCPSTEYHHKKPNGGKPGQQNNIITNAEKNNSRKEPTEGIIRDHPYYLRRGGACGD